MSEYSHVGIAWVVSNRVLIIEAVPPLVRLYPLSKALPFYLIRVPYNYWNSEVEEYALSRIGEEYSSLDAILGFLNKLVIGGDVKWQCAELVNSILKYSKVFTEEQAKLATPHYTVFNLLKLGSTIEYCES